MYVRFEGTTVNSRGAKPGVFALANGLAHSGKLSLDDYTLWRESNDWMNAAYTDPSEIDGTLFDRSINPRTECWFRVSADHLLARVHQYLRLLDRYGVGWIERPSVSEEKRTPCFTQERVKEGRGNDEG